MTADDAAPSNDADAAERTLIQKCSHMLLSGEAPGPLTVTRLAELTGLKRWKLTHRHTDLKDAFQTAAGNTPQARDRSNTLEQRLASEREKTTALRAENRRLNSILERYALVISELSMDLASAEQDLDRHRSVPRIPRHDFKSF